MWIPNRGHGRLCFSSSRRRMDRQEGAHSWGDSKGGRRPLTYDDRLAIERGLNRGDRIAWIARTIGRAPKVVAEEVSATEPTTPRMLRQHPNPQHLLEGGALARCAGCKGMCRRAAAGARTSSVTRSVPISRRSRARSWQGARSAATPARAGSAAGAVIPIGTTRRNGQDAADARRSESRQERLRPRAFESAITLISDGSPKARARSTYSPRTPAPYRSAAASTTTRRRQGGGICRSSTCRRPYATSPGRSRSPPNPPTFRARVLEGEAVDGFLRPRPGRPRQRRRDGHGGREAGQGLAVHLDAVRQAHRVPVLHPPTGQVGDQRGRGARHPPGALRLDPRPSA